jgi:hypothetical protein
LEFSAAEIRPNVYHFSFNCQYQLTSSMVRLQEYYESPFEEIKRQYFSLEKFMDSYASKMPSKNFTYFTDWSGFNIPGDVVLDFYKEFKYDFSFKERTLLDLVLLFRHEKLHGEENNNFYIIATYKNPEEKSIIKHELAHAYWYLHKDTYAVNATSLLNNRKIISKESLDNSEKSLKAMGYSEKVYSDELQAYYSTSPKKFLVKALKYPEGEKLSGAFKRNFDNFDEEQVKKLNGKVLYYAE